MRKIGLVLLFIGTAVLFYLFGPALKQEVQYVADRAVGIRYSVDTIEPWSAERPITPVNRDFSIVIPKINATAPIVDNVDASNSIKYLAALKNGVAHADGTAYPGDVGNMYLFAHSTDAFYNVGRYNAVFFLIGHLRSGDEVDIYYRGNLYKYVVYDKKVVEPTDSQYLGTLTEGEKTLTLQTCYPPGTTLKRLVVLAKLEDLNQ